uniref:Uncharacterized protein n=1 Tax=Helianthus annuus TaxID=4232 RepID=A0A251VE55_HELAN
MPLSSSKTQTPCFQFRCSTLTLIYFIFNTWFINIFIQPIQDWQTHNFQQSNTHPHIRFSLSRLKIGLKPSPHTHNIQSSSIFLECFKMHANKFTFLETTSRNHAKLALHRNVQVSS